MTRASPFDSDADLAYQWDTKGKLFSLAEVLPSGIIVTVAVA